MTTSNFVRICALRDAASNDKLPLFNTKARLKSDPQAQTPPGCLYSDRNAAPDYSILCRFLGRRHYHPLAEVFGVRKTPGLVHCDQASVGNRDTMGVVRCSDL